MGYNSTHQFTNQARPFWPLRGCSLEWVLRSFIYPWWYRRSLHISATSTNLSSLTRLVWLNPMGFWWPLRSSRWASFDLIGFRITGTTISISTTVMQRKRVTRMGTLLQVSSLVHLKYGVTYAHWYIDKARFPSGMKNLTDQIHGLGMYVMPQICFMPIYPN